MMGGGGGNQGITKPRNLYRQITQSISAWHWEICRLIQCCIYAEPMLGQCCLNAWPVLSQCWANAGPMLSQCEPALKMLTQHCGSTGQQPVIRGKVCNSGRTSRGK